MASAQSILNTAAQYLGTKDFNNFCEAFVEQATQGHTGVYPSAIQAWIGQQKSAVQGTQGIQPGDTVYFSADKSNGGYGHTGIYVGNGQFISATYNGVQTEDLNKWQQSTGQKLLGYVPSGAAGRGTAQFAMSNGKMLQGQMTEASQTPDQLMQQKLQQFQAQQHIAQSQHLMDAQQYGDQAQTWMNMSQQPKQQSLPNVTTAQTAIQPQSQTPGQPAYPYGQYTTPTNQPVPPGTPPTPGTPTLPNSTTPDLTKPQINLNPAQQQ